MDIGRPSGKLFILDTAGVSTILHSKTERVVRYFKTWTLRVERVMGWASIEYLYKITADDELYFRVAHGSGSSTHQDGTQQRPEGIAVIEGHYHPGS